MERYRIVVMHLAHIQTVLPVSQELHVLDDAPVGEIGVTLQHVLVVEHQLREDGGAFHEDASAGDGSVGVQPYVVRFSDDSATQQGQQEVGTVRHVLPEERSIGTEEVFQQHDEGIADTGGRIGVCHPFVTDNLEECLYASLLLCHRLLFLLQI